MDFFFFKLADLFHLKNIFPEIFTVLNSDTENRINIVGEVTMEETASWAERQSRLFAAGFQNLKQGPGARSHF